MTDATTAPCAFSLRPGDVALGERGDELETLLGSCVAIVLTDPRRTVGVMCHIVHCRPAPPHRPDDTAFGDAALRSMVALLQARGVVARLCEAYVYGGGNMFPQFEQPLSIGDDNAAWAVAALRALGVRVLALDLGGTVYRRLRWTVGVDAPHVTAMPVGVPA